MARLVIETKIVFGDMNHGLVLATDAHPTLLHFIINQTASNRKPETVSEN
jgi:hypothetical protein